MLESESDNHVKYSFWDIQSESLGYILEMHLETAYMKHMSESLALSLEVQLIYLPVHTIVIPDIGHRVSEGVFQSRSANYRIDFTYFNDNGGVIYNQFNKIVSELGWKGFHGMLIDINGFLTLVKEV